jgi:glutaredoxin
VLSDELTVVEITETEQDEEDYDILIQGSDRQHPAIVIRRKHRGKGATIRTISKFGQHSALYADYETIIAAYLDRRQHRRKNPTTRGDSESGNTTARESWIDKTIQGVVGRPDNGKRD